MSTILTVNSITKLSKYNLVVCSTNHFMTNLSFTPWIVVFFLFRGFSSSVIVLYGDDN